MKKNKCTTIWFTLIKKPRANTCESYNPEELAETSFMEV